MSESGSGVVPAARIREANTAPRRADGAYVLYWMIAARRTTWNYGLQRAIELARRHGRPLLVLEALRCDYPWASDRLHRFVIDGMADNAAALAARRVAYFPYVEPTQGAGRGLLAMLAGRACAVVTDEYPAFFVPRMVAAAGRDIDVALEVVDSNGLLPLRSSDRTFVSAYQFRRFLQRHLPAHLDAPPLADPLQGGVPEVDMAGPGVSQLRALVPDAVLRRWPAAFIDAEDARRLSFTGLPIDHTVTPVPHAGGPAAAVQRLREFVGESLRHYVERRNHPDHDASSRLSDYLHFGHLSTHQVLAEMGASEDWSPESVSGERSGKRTGWWGMSPGAEAFLDQLVTWRELGYNMCVRRLDHDRYESLPDWAQGTLAQHAADPRPAVYDLEQFETASTHDELWNAAQNQLRSEGRIHNYLRMLWGKKILHWSASPLQALETMICLNDRYATDGRDPNSYSGIFWCLGRYDRPWGPERPVFGKIRYMTCENTRRKLKLDAYVRRHASPVSRPGSVSGGNT